MRPEPQAIDGLVGRYPALARAVVTLHRAFLDRSQAMHTLADRLNQDPFLGEAIHRILTNVSAIRSISEILTSVDDVEAAQLHRFHAIPSEENTRLSAAAQGLPPRSEERRVGNECGSTCSSRWSPYTYKTKHIKKE